MFKRKAFTMSILSIVVFLIILFMAAVRNNETRSDDALGRQPSLGKLKYFVNNAMNQQRRKIYNLFDRIQTNSKRLLSRLEEAKARDASPQRALTAAGILRPDKEAADRLSTESKTRSFNHYATGHGSSGAGASYPAASYHHHSIGFDTINIVVSMSILSFLLQTIQSLLSGTRLVLPQVTQARSHTTASAQQPKRYDKTELKKSLSLKRKTLGENLNEL